MNVSPGTEHKDGSRSLFDEVTGSYDIIVTLLSLFSRSRFNFRMSFP